MPAKTKSLSKAVINQREKFCQLYVLTGNGTQSYLDSFTRIKKADSAAVLAWRLLRDVNILGRIRELRVIGHEQLTHTFEETVQEIDRLAHFDPANMYGEDGQLLDLVDMDEATRKMVNEISTVAGIKTVKYGKDKRGYLDMMMRFYNGYEHHQRSGANKELKVYLLYPNDALA